MSTIALTDLTVKALKPGLYFDTKTPGFGIRVGKNRRTWLVLQGQRSAKVRLGHYPALSLADARKRALVALGTPYEPSIAPTFLEAREQFLALDRWRPRSHYQLARWLRLYFNWTKRIDKISHNDVATVIDSINAPSEANHAVQSIRTFFNWCVPRYLKHSPCAGLKKPHKYTPRARVLTDQELQLIWQPCPDFPVYGTIVRLLILTGQRRGEIAALQSSWIQHDRINLAKEIVKNKRAHSFPIGALSAQLLLEAKATYISRFNTGSTKSLVDWSRAKTALDKRSGVTNWTIHDLRRTYASNLARLGVRLEVIERLLNHVSGSFGGIVAVYQHYDFWPEMVDAVQKYEKWLLSVVG